MAEHSSSAGQNPTAGGPDTPRPAGADGPESTARGRLQRRAAAEHDENAPRDLPRLRQLAGVSVIFVSDLHLQPEPPRIRSAEPDWLAAQARPLEQIARLAHDAQAPVVYCGDLFTHWNPPVWFVNWVIEHLPSGYAIPGNHDLENHRLDSLPRTAYATLTHARTIVPLPHFLPYPLDDVILYGHPYVQGRPQLRPVGPEGRQGLSLRVAVVHAYCWLRDKGRYPGVAEELAAPSWGLRLKKAGYDAGFFGDQHIGFSIPGDPHGTPVVDVGTLQRRTVDEMGYRPAVGLLFRDGRVGRWFLDCSQDRFADVGTVQVIAQANQIDLSELIAATEARVSAQDVTFAQALRAIIRQKDLASGVASVLIEEMQKAGIG